MNKNESTIIYITQFTLALTGCAGTKAEENHNKPKQEQAAKETKRKIS